MTTEDLYQLGLRRIGRIKNQMSEFDQCNHDTLEECVTDAEDGLENVIKEQFTPTVRLGLAEMKGEWTVRRNRSIDDTEKEFASRIVGVLGDMIMEEFDGSE